MAQLRDHRHLDQIRSLHEEFAPWRPTSALHKKFNQNFCRCAQSWQLNNSMNGARRDGLGPGRDGDDDVNIARFHPDSGYGFVYGTKQGRVRVMSPRPWSYYDC